MAVTASSLPHGALTLTAAAEEGSLELTGENNKGGL